MNITIGFEENDEINIHRIPAEDFIRIAKSNDAEVKNIGDPGKRNIMTASFYIGKIEITLFA